MTKSNIKSVLFDYPEEIPSENVDITSSSYLSLRRFRSCLQIYTGFLFCQYLTTFACVPFDSILNRPSILVISSFYSILMFSVSAVMLPLYYCKEISPLTLKCLSISGTLEFVGLLFNITSVVTGLNAENMYSLEYDSNTKEEKKVDVTLYIQISFILALFFNVIAFFICVVNLLIVCDILKYFKQPLSAHNSDNPPQYETLHFTPH